MSNYDDAPLAHPQPGSEEMADIVREIYWHGFNHHAAPDSTVPFVVETYVSRMLALLTEAHQRGLKEGGVKELKWVLESYGTFENPIRMSSGIKTRLATLDQGGEQSHE